MRRSMLVLALGTLACTPSAPAASCVVSYPPPEGPGAFVTCVEYTNASFDTSFAIRAACDAIDEPGDGGFGIDAVISGSPCSSVDRIGRCNKPTTGATVTTSYYPLFTAEAAQASCAQQGGTWTMP